MANDEGPFAHVGIIRKGAGSEAVGVEFLLVGEPERAIQVSCLGTPQDILQLGSWPVVGGGDREVDELDRRSFLGLQGIESRDVLPPVVLLAIPVAVLRVKVICAVAIVFNDAEALCAFELPELP